MADKSCSTCKYDGKSAGEAPCVECKHRYMDKYTPMTNGDRIRQMTDEELMELIRCPHSVDGCSVAKISCEECTLQWLREVADHVME